MKKSGITNADPAVDVLDANDRAPRADAPLETALALERRLFERLFDSEDQKEGMRAFLEKRTPAYRGC